MKIVPGQTMVSCIMPTRNRPRFVRQAIDYFLRQNYPARELIIVDDGQAPRLDLPDDAAIRLIRLSSSSSLGQKRNVACDAACGDLIAHWDDDAWQAPDRLARQVEALAVSDADACGAADLCFFSPSTGIAWRRRGQNPHDLAEPTLMYRRECWAGSRFAAGDPPRVPPALAQLTAPRRCVLPEPMLMFAYLPPGNPDGHNFHDARWSRMPVEEIVRALSLDWGFYAELRSGKPHAPHAAPGPRPLTIGAHWLVSDGYGSMAEYLALGLDRAGVAMNLLPYSVNASGLTSRLLDLLAESRPEPDAPFLHYSPVDAPGQQLNAARYPFVYTMWESNGLPRSWLPALHRAHAVIVPTRWCAGIFRDHGVRDPIAVVPDGVDPAVYHYAPRDERPGVTTLMVGMHVQRKHFREGIAAWKQAFAGDSDARLLLKAHHQRGGYRPDDPRISFVDVNEPSRGIAHWYRQADVFLALGNEGFGLPLIEAMACGLTVIALDSEGQEDACADANGLLLPVPPAGMEPHVIAPHGHCGARAVPSVDAIAAHLRWVAGHRTEAAEMGRAASRWAIEHRNVWDKAPAVLRAIEHRMTVQRVPSVVAARRSVVMGAP